MRTVTTKSASKVTYDTPRMIQPIKSGIFSTRFAMAGWTTRTTRRQARPQMRLKRRHMYPRKLNGSLL